MRADRQQLVVKFVAMDMIARDELERKSEESRKESRERERERRQWVSI